MHATRRTIGLRAAAAALALLTVAQHAQGAYFTDFESGAGAEWSSALVTSHPAFSAFLGRFNNESVTLDVATDPGALYRLTFDFYAIDRWRGPDGGGSLLTIDADGAVVFSHTFNNEGPEQTYPFAPDIGPAKLGFSASRDDAIYRAVTVDFIAAGETTSVSFTASGLIGTTIQASWGIDNVRVVQTAAAIPTPGAGALAFIGAALVTMRRGRWNLPPVRAAAA